MYVCAYVYAYIYTHICSLGLDIPILIISKLSTEISEDPCCSTPWMETCQGGTGYISLYNLLYCPSRVMVPMRGFR